MFISVLINLFDFFAIALDRAQIEYSTVKIQPINTNETPLECNCDQYKINITRDTRVFCTRFLGTAYFSGAIIYASDPMRLNEIRQ